MTTLAIASLAGLINTETITI